MRPFRGRKLDRAAPSNDGRFPLAGDSMKILATVLCGLSAVMIIPPGMYRQSLTAEQPRFQNEIQVPRGGRGKIYGDVIVIKDLLSYSRAIGKRENKS